MAIKKFFTGLLTNEESEDHSFDEEVESVVNETPRTKLNEAKSEDKHMAINETRNSNKTTGSSNAIELKVVRPESWESALQIGHYLLDNCTVVLNLEATSKETARRIVDFLNGVAFAIEGEVKSVTNSTCIITPKNVSVSGELLGEKPDQPKSAPRDSFDNF